MSGGRGGGREVRVKRQEGTSERGSKERERERGSSNIYQKTEREREMEKGVRENR